MTAGLLALAVALAGLLATDDRDVIAAERGQAAVDFALAQVGDPYRYGGSGPDSWDCSGLSQAAWAAAGVDIPRVSRDQHAQLPSVPLDQLQPGDLIFSYSPVRHVALYVGGGQMVHSPNSGGVVEVRDVRWGNVVGAARPGGTGTSKVRAASAAEPEPVPATGSLLRSGDRGPAVSAWQEGLNGQGYGLAVDGVFGPLTDRATRDFQRRSGIAVDGVVGRQSRRALQG